MQLLKDRILKDGTVRGGSILKVDSFLNHQIDIELMEAIGAEFHRRFAGTPVTRILTIEASGIGIACIAARYFRVPVVFAKKTVGKNMDGELYTAKVPSYTKKVCYDIMVSKRFILPEDRVLILDDFLAQGNALKGLIEIVHCADAEVAGCGIVIEKAFQGGGKLIRDMGVRVESLARIKSLAGDVVTFED